MDTIKGVAIILMFPFLAFVLGAIRMASWWGLAIYGALALMSTAFGTPLWVPLALIATGVGLVTDPEKFERGSAPHLT